MTHPPKLDLHGLPHEEVTDTVHSFINESWNAVEVHIITGHSRRMKHIVKEVLSMYDVEVEDGDPHNPGYLRILK